MKKYYWKYLILAIIGSVVIGLAFYLFLSNYLDREEIVIVSKDISAGEEIKEDDLNLKEYYKNSLPDNYLKNKKDVIGKVINIERKKDDYISADMFNEETNTSIFDNLSPGDVLIAVNIQHLEPILEELKKGDFVSIVSTTIDDEIIPSEYFDSINVNNSNYTNRNNYYEEGNDIKEANNYFLIDKDFISKSTFEISKNIILINGQVVIKNLEIVCIERSINNSNKNILMSSDNNNTSIYFKCDIEEAPIIARLTKSDNYKIIVESI